MKSTPDVKSVRDLRVYRAAFGMQRTVFGLTKRWPREETYSLIDQIRRSSRSIGANLAESWAKRRYPAHFLSKLTDADAELQETRHWLVTAFDSGYMDRTEFDQTEARCADVGAKLGAMIVNYEKFCIADRATAARSRSPSTGNDTAPQA